MDERPEPGPSGWTFPKVVGAIVGLIGMVGFGVCSLCGMVMSIDGGYGDVWLFVLFGAVLAFLFGWLMVTMFRKAREEREDHEAREARRPRDP
jgi:cytochrome bd-type quinol oxidase subunit 1